MTSHINFTKTNAELTAKRMVLSEAECRQTCVAPNGYFRLSSLYEDDEMNTLTESDIAECIKGLRNRGYATCGVPIKSPEERTDEIMAALRKYQFTPYKLRRVRISDPASDCELEGWEQGKDDSDCWIDAFLFSLFVNRSIANTLIDDIKKRFYDTEDSTTESEQYENNAIFCMNLYLNLLRERKPLFKASTVGDIKGSVKWCMIWYILKYFELTLTPDEYVGAQSKATLNTNLLTIASGGDPNLLAFFISKISKKFIASLYSEEFTNHGDITQIVQSNSTPDTKDKFVLISLNLSGPNSNDRYFANISNVRFGGLTQRMLESISIGASGHNTTFTNCNGWKYYDNKASPTTSIETSIAAKVDKALYNEHSYTKLVMLVYGLMPRYKGGVRKTRKHKRMLPKRKGTRKGTRKGNRRSK